MNTAKRIQLLLSPVLIAMLALMLAVVSFGWYQASLGEPELDATNSSVNVNVTAPEYIDVQITALGDNYTCNIVEGEKVFAISDINPTLGYFGQTGEYEANISDNDRPYIMFYLVEIEAVNKTIDVSSAYVDGLQIIKEQVPMEGFETPLNYVKDNPQEEEIQTKFKVYFYTLVDDKYTNESETFNANNGTEYVTYMGIYFDDPNPETIFAYSDFMYYGATYRLNIKFE